jgi:hypothetical protein
MRRLCGPQCCSVNSASVLFGASSWSVELKLSVVFRGQSIGGCQALLSREQRKVHGDKA